MSTIAVNVEGESFLRSLTALLEQRMVVYMEQCWHKKREELLEELDKEAGRLAAEVAIELSRQVRMFDITSSSLCIEVKLPPSRDPIKTSQK